MRKMIKLFLFVLYFVNILWRFEGYSFLTCIFATNYGVFFFTHKLLNTYILILLKTLDFPKKKLPL